MRFDFNPNGTLVVEGDPTVYRSRAEAGLARQMRQFGIIYNYEEKKYKLSNGEYYTPDFSFPKELPFVDDASSARMKDILEAYKAKNGLRWDFTWIEAKPSDVIFDLMESFDITRRFGKYLQGIGPDDLEVFVEFSSKQFVTLRTTDKMTKELIKPKILAEDTGCNVLVVGDLAKNGWKISIMLTKDAIIFMREHPIANLEMWQKRIEKARAEELNRQELARVKLERNLTKEMNKRQICDDVRELFQASSHTPRPNLFRRKCVFCDDYVDAGKGYCIHANEWHVMHRDCVDT